MQTTVVVGYDQTPSSERALATAADQAVRCGSALAVVHAYRPPGADGPGEPSVVAAYRKAAEELAESGADRVRSSHPDLTVHAAAVVGSPAKVLAASAHGAELLVVGNRGRGGFPAMQLGSTSMRVLAEACCPVLVVRGGEHARRDRIVAAVDIDGPCDTVLRLAFEEALRRGSALTVIHVWDEPWVVSYDEEQGDGLADDVAAILANRDERLEAHLLEWRRRYPDVRVFRQMATGSAASILVEAAEHADLIVAGARRHGDGEHGLRIGPVGHTLLRHADCPVLVVPID
ncbi:universal stress protein [Catenulispora subtropica]|uniref:Universal stress protein n=1 Tax=Catenulispora subtropica TaxID=450798 RepID=A0ABN2TI52_9ACTN